MVNPSETDYEIIKALNVKIAKRSKIFARLQTTYDYSKTATAENISLFRPRYEHISVLENEFEVIQDDIIELNSELKDSTQAVEVNQVQAAFDNMAYEAAGKFLSLIQSTPPAPETYKEAVMVTHHLPRIDIPTFSGNISDWTNFYSLFNSMVNENKSLSDSEKFHYLRSHLKEPALSVISNFVLTSTNYSLAFDTLKRRYQDKRRLASYYVQEIRNFPGFTNPTYSNFQKYLSVHSNAVNALKALDVPDLLDFILFQLSLSNLDAGTRKRFEGTQSANSIPSYQQLIDYVTNQSRTLELTTPSHESKTPNIKSDKPYNTKRSTLLANTTPHEASPAPQRASKGKCLICNSSVHSMYVCPDFLKFDVNRRYQTIRSLRRCFGCFGSHGVSDCGSTNSCKVCNSKFHHSLLHRDNAGSASSTGGRQQDKPSISAPAKPQVPHADHEPEVTMTVSTCQIPASTSSRSVILATTRALIQDSTGSYVPVRAVVDPGSQVSVISAPIVQRLGLKRVKSSIQISGISSARAKVQGAVNCILKSRFENKMFSVQAIVLDRIVNDLPSTQISHDLFQRFSDLQLADESFHSPGKIDFLIGVDLFTQILSDEPHSFIKGYPSAVNTAFGWIILGPIKEHTENPDQVSTLLTAVTSLDDIVRKFWETEEVAQAPPVDPEDLLCEAHFAKTHYRDIEGRYGVSLPFQPDSPPIGNNRDSALKCYLQLERRLTKSPSLEVEYHDFLHQYLAMGHMTLAVTSSSYVIPHHAVVTNKIRVVFHASFSDSSKLSLNQRLMAGPKLQRDLPAILINFRLHPIALCADIRMMYRQFWIKPEDRKFQHIFWRPEPNSPILEYELNTITYGLKPSAYQAQRCLLQLVKDEGDRFPLASEVILKCGYVDNFVSGASSLESALQLRSELTDMLSLAGLELRKWASNEPKLLEGIPTEHLEDTLSFSEDEQVIKILGLMWDPTSDSFRYHVRCFEGEITKRSILSYIARIFDPLGLLAPVVFWAKEFLQKLWNHRLDWDESLPPELQELWLQNVKLYPELESLRVPRHISTFSNYHILIGFSDASEKGYAAAVYLRSNYDTEVRCSLLQAKSRVAPVKTVSIPRLELCGALLLSNLLESVLTSFPTECKGIYLFSDSQIVLSWIRTSPHKLKTYVANRVTEIGRITSSFIWSHVSSSNNPADLASRGCDPASLVNCSKWWQGPSFLRDPVNSWPIDNSPQDQEDVVPELKETQPQVLSVSKEHHCLYETIANFSQFRKMRRTFAIISRFIQNCRSPPVTKKKQELILSPKHLHDGTLLAVRATQIVHFHDLLKNLTSNKGIKSTLRPLAPFLDEDGLIRVGGRLRNSELHYNQKYPLLLPKDCYLSKLICDHYHCITSHSGPRIVQALIQMEFWIISLRGLLRRRIRSCLQCFKFINHPSQPRMADLPSSRVRASPPFSQVGTDFAGPIPIKESTRRSSSIGKAYICVFVCMSTKAAHLEAVSSLSTKAFLDTFDRFVARRGCPSDLYSDCGRNFVGANRSLQEFDRIMKDDNQKIYDHITSHHVNWMFNPAFAPNFGGLWEAVVKSTKSLLYKMTGDNPLTFEELSTILAKIEAVLNSRPLCAVSSDPHDGTDYLSPGHFLIGRPLLAPPEEPVAGDISYTTRWTRLRQIHQSFWRRWSNEYLTTITQRHKWTKATPTLSVGDVVFMQGIKSSPLSWPIGRVSAVHPGVDGTVRVVTVRSGGSSYLRPVNKLICLPAQQ